jgi:Zn finger protein HypA/HybF involved in hydrogenase expression
MHEAGVTERILEVVLEHATEAHARRVTDVYLEVGTESGIDTGSVELHWPLLAKGSAAEGATLHFDTTAEPFTFRLTSIEVDDAAGVATAGASEQA